MKNTTVFLIAAMVLSLAAGYIGTALYYEILILSKVTVVAYDAPGPNQERDQGISDFDYIMGYKTAEQGIEPPERISSSSLWKNIRIEAKE